VSGTQRISDAEFERAREDYVEKGFFIFRNVVSQERLAELTQSLSAEYERVSREGKLFAGGGLLSGHLNCFPGAGTRFVYETLEQCGIIGLIKELHPKVQRLPNVGCNFNLPGSYTQHWHTDRPFDNDFMICNVTAVDTTVENGATDIIPGTHKRFYKYTRFLMEGCEKHGQRVLTRRGDVVLRNSNVWHRGMTNTTKVPRPMLAFTWEDGGSVVPDPFSIHGGEIRFLPNWFKLSPMGRFREKLFVKVPAAYTALRVARSLVDSKY